MGEKLAQNRYGKNDIRVTKVTRHKGHHELIEFSVDVMLTGKFAASYLDGDNSDVVATDSMKNTVYVLARKHRLENIESFAISLAEHFVNTYRQVRSAEINIRQACWQRIDVSGKPHRHSFVSGGSELRTCAALCTGTTTQISGGLTGLLVLKTTDSGFSGFVRDEYTTLPETTDRIFATMIAARWSYSRRTDFNKASDSIRAALLETFATHRSDAVQQTLYAMGRAALRRCKAISDIELTLPNKHRVPVDLSPFKLDNRNEIFVWTDEPYGNIHGRVERS